MEAHGGSSKTSLNCDQINYYFQKGVVGSSQVIGVISMPGRHSYLGNSRARTGCACNRCGMGVEFNGLLRQCSSQYQVVYSHHRHVLQTQQVNVLLLSKLVGLPGTES